MEEFQEKSNCRPETQEVLGFYYEDREGKNSWPEAGVEKLTPRHAEINGRWRVIVPLGLLTQVDSMVHSFLTNFFGQSLCAGTVQTLQDQSHSFRL